MIPSSLGFSFMILESAASAASANCFLAVASFASSERNSSMR